MVKLLFLGLDGATWDILDPLIDGGKLPTFEKLVEEGSRGPLRSTKPEVTYPAWRVLSSGKHPGKLGVYGWNRPDFQQRTFVFANSSDYRTRDVWDYAAQAGYRSAVVNQPGTFPPLEIDGILLSGPESQGEEVVHPPERTELVERYARQSHGITGAVDRGDLDRVCSIIENHVDLSVDLADEADILHHVVFLTDTVQHHLWDDEEALERVWTAVDEGLDRLLEETDPDVVIAASDHGFQPLDYIVSVNQILAEEGLASVEMPTGASMVGGLGLDRDTVLRWAGRLGIDEQSLSHLPSWVKDLVPDASGELSARREHAIQWDDTQALTGDGKGVHVTDPSIVEDVREALLSATGPDGEQLFDAVRERESVWGGPYLDRAPDLLVEGAEGIEPSGTLHPETVRPVEPGETWIAHHHPEGIVLAWGEGVRGGSVDGASIVDVMPTILAALGAAVPNDVDGEVLDVFEAPPEVERCDPLPVKDDRQAYSPEEQEAIEERLEDLGYL